MHQGWVALCSGVGTQGHGGGWQFNRTLHAVLILHALAAVTLMCQSSSIAAQMMPPMAWRPCNIAQSPHLRHNVVCPALHPLPPGAELERRFKAGEVVYEEDMVHRPAGVVAAAPGDAAMADVEEGFAPAASWVAEEVRGWQGRLALKLAGHWVGRHLGRGYCHSNWRSWSSSSLAGLMRCLVLYCLQVNS